MEERKEPSTAADSSNNSENESSSAIPNTEPKPTGFLTKDQVLEQFGDFVTQPKRLEEGYKIRRYLKAMPTLIEEGSEWYFMPKEWLDLWELFCYVDVI